MDILMKIGRYAGTVRDVHPAYARAMLADGRAVPVPEPRQAPPAAPAPRKGKK